MEKLKAFFTRVALVYFILYIFPVPLPLSHWPLLQECSLVLGNIYDITVQLSGIFVFDMESVAKHSTGSSDRPYDLLLLFNFLCLALLVAGVWGILKKREPKLPLEPAFLGIVLRYYLVYAMLLYGFKKLLLVQFLEPSFLDLLSTMGSVSPMKLNWTSMGIAPGYSRVIGLVEIIGALLLLKRKTIGAGVLILLFVMVQVLAINLFYDVPVKQHTFHLIAMVVLVGVPYASRIKKALFSNQSLEALQLHTAAGFPFQKWHKSVKIIAVILLVSNGLMLNIKKKKAQIANQAHHSIYGLYEFKGKALPAEGLAYVVVESSTYVYFIFEDKSVAYCTYVFDGSTLRIDAPNFEVVSKDFEISEIRGRHSVRWSSGEQAFELDVRRISKQNFALMQKEFNLVQEAPNFKNGYSFK